MSPRPFKVCSCRRTFTRAEWLALPSRGVMLGLVSMRNCPSCDSTMAVEVRAEMQTERPAAPREVSL